MADYLKTVRKVDTCLPAKENMTPFQDAAQLAITNGKWQKHPTRKRKTQKIQLVTGLGPLWGSGKPETDVPVNACVVHDTKAGKFFVFMTTDTNRTARQIINTYRLRPEIEGDFRQMKDFGNWKTSKVQNITISPIIS